MGRKSRAIIEAEGIKTTYCDVPRCDESMARHTPMINLTHLWKPGANITNPRITLLGNCNHNCWQCYCYIVRHDTHDVHLPISPQARRNAKVDTSLLQKGIVI